MYSPTGAVGSLSTGVAVGIAVVIGAIALIVGFLAGVIVFYCISKHQFKTICSKPEPSSDQQQQPATSNPLQQTCPEYEEVIEMRKNSSYGELTRMEKRAITSKHNPHTSEPVSSSQQQQQTGADYEEPVGKDEKIDPRANVAYQCWLAVIKLVIAIRPQYFHA